MPGDLSAEATSRHRSRKLVLLAGAAAAVSLLVAGDQARRLLFPSQQLVGALSPAQLAAARSDPLRAEGLDLADRVLRDYPQSLDGLCARGLILNRFGNEAEAVACWEECLNREPRFATAWYCLGRNAFDQGKYEACVAHMERALETEPGMWDALLYQGRAELARGMVDAAVDAFERFAEQSPQSTEGHFRLGQAQLQAGRLDAATVSFEAALAIDPKCKHAWYGLAQVCQRQGDLQRMQEHLSRFEELDTARMRVGRGMRRGYDDQASMKETVAHLHTVVAKVHAAHGDLETARAHMRRATELAPQLDDPVTPADAR